ncbi:ubinuclein-1 isoform X2 [Anabrus simplex]|uniref:ubinuclein-1 isoform X2 n=1 Tax=Anabrus simplex TaxID=316456 RepID=UPI0035A2E87B
MSDQRRNSLTSIATNKKEKKSKDSPRTVRFTLPLPESNEEACPEFNYRILLSSAEKKRKSKLKEDGYVNGVDPLAEDDDDKLKEIARQFEEKYGGGRKKHGRFEDYVDLGAGYDENDPFIDNTDAYDEVVPEEITTVHGGFYINCGALEFKEVSDQSDIEEIKDLKIRKRLKKPKLPDKRSTEIIKKRKFVSHEREILKKKKKRAIDDLVRKKAVTVKELLREKRESLEASSVAEIKEVQEQKKSVVNSISKPVSTSIVDVIESVVSAARGGEDSSKDSSSVVSKSGSGSAVSTDTEENRDAEVEEEKEKNTPKEEIKLPDNLTDDIRELVMGLKTAAKTSAEGKCKFFSPKVNTMLLNVEQKCQPLSCTSRQMVYGYLAFYLPCTKDTLMKRAKKLVVLAEEGKIKEPLRKLGEAVNKMMPPLLERFSRECQKVAEEKNVEESRSSVSDNEGNPENSKTPTRNPKIPRRRFPWTSELRELLCEVVRIKLQCADLKKSRKETAEDILRNFLEKEVKSLWPPGWMKVTALLRESRDARTSVMTKNKKTNVIKKQLPSTPVMPGPVATVLPAAPTLPTSAGMVNMAARVPKSASSMMPTNSCTVVPTVSVTKSQIPSNAKPKLSTSEVTYSASPRTKASSIVTANPSTRVHSPSNGVTITISPSASNGTIHVSPVSGVSKPSAPSISVNPVKSKVVGDITLKTSSASGKSSPTIPLEKQIVSGISVTKVKNSVEKIPAKGLDLSLSGANKSVSSAVPSNSNKVKNSSSVSIIPVTISSSSQKSPAAALPLINIPDCISVTPSIPSPVSTANVTATSNKPMSLKQRILHDTAKDRSNSSSIVNVSPPVNKLEEEGIEVIEIVADNVRTDAGNIKQRSAGIEVPGKLKTEFKKKKKLESTKEVESPTVLTALPEVRKPVIPTLSDKDAERKLNEETAAATDLLSQIINESLELPNPSSREVYHLDSKPLPPIHRSVIQKSVSPPPAPPVLSVTKESISNSSAKEDNDFKSEQSNCDAPQPDDAEESVQLEMDRVMKELRELQGHMSGENEPDATSVNYSPPKISSSVSVIPVNSVVNVRSQPLSKTTKEPDITCKPINQARRVSLGTGFQEEFQKHLFQDIPREVEPVGFKVAKNKAVYPVSSITKDNVSTPSEESASHSHGTVINSPQFGSRSNSNPASVYPKLPSAGVAEVPNNPCERRFPPATNSSILHMQDTVKSNAHNSQSGVQPSVIPTDDQFSLFQYLHSFSGSAQHSPPY